MLKSSKFPYGWNIICNFTFQLVANSTLNQYETCVDKRFKE